MITVNDIYNYIDSSGFAPFSQQQSYDNSGICVGQGGEEVKRVLTALDITCDTADEAREKRCELVISHHPVIFQGLKRLCPNEPAVMLSRFGICAICAHTSFDSANGGMNDLLAKKLGLTIAEPLSYEEGKQIGFVCETHFETSASHLAAICKKRLGCRCVRYTESLVGIKRVAVCSGSGGSLMTCAEEKGCQALITGDVRHDRFIKAKNDGFCLIDAGHFYTENIFHEYLAERLAEEFPELEIVRAETSVDPVNYL